VIVVEGEPARSAVAAAFWSTPTRVEVDRDPPRPGLAGWGCVSDDLLRSVVRDARREVVDVVAARMCA
jgi:hypothetical protein